jgi:REP element-mobilizing transposase RayT
MNRGARKAPIFLGEEDNRAFLGLVGETVERFEWELHAYSLMPNHFHLLVRSREGTLSAGMKHLLGTYTQRLNRRQGWDGPLFRGRFKSQLVAGERHLIVLVAYIHLNPVVADLAKRADEECWTSYRAYMQKEPGPAWLTTSFFTRHFGGREQLHAFVEAHRLGRLEYPEELDRETGLFSDDPGEPGKSGEAGPAHSIEKTLERIGELTGADASELRRRERGPGANPARRFAMWALSRRCGITHREIADALDVSPCQVGRVLSGLRRQPARDPIKGWMQRWGV